jgi:thiol-disulfide isomerase/thioredoxin
MTRIFGLLIPALILLANATSAQERRFEELEIHPQPLQSGKEVEIKLDAVKAGLTLPNEPIYVILFISKSGNYFSIDTLLQAGRKWHSARITIPANTDAVAFKFVQGSRQFANSGRGFVFAVKNEKGEDQVSSLYSQYRFYQGDGNAGISKPNYDLSMRYYNQWVELVDPSTLSFYDRAILLQSKKDSVGLCSHLSSLSVNDNITEGQINNLFNLIKRCPKDVSTHLSEVRAAKYPKGTWYWRQWFDAMRNEPEVSSKLVWIKAYQLANPEDTFGINSPGRDMYHNIMAFSARALDMTTFKKASSKLESDDTQFERFANNALTFLNQALAKDSLIAELTPLAGQLTAKARNKWQNTTTGAMGQSPIMYKISLQRLYYNCASSYGAMLQKQKQYDSAAYYTGLAAKYNEFKTPQFNERYFAAAEYTLNPTELIEELKIAFRQEGYTTKIKEIFLRAYAHAGKTDGDQVIAALISERIDKLRKELSGKMLNKPATDFKLPGLNGGEVSLASLKGKVVLIDFWATWCAPCIASFPSMQQLVDANKNKNDVAILFIDVWQKETNKYEVVKQFFRERPFHFDVYMDLKDEVVKQFGVTGIPTKIVIDKNGNIRFFSLGFASDEAKGVEELQTMIDMAAEAS